jgi:hypothetical protein
MEDRLGDRKVDQMEDRLEGQKVDRLGDRKVGRLEGQRKQAGPVGLRPFPQALGLQEWPTACLQPVRR